MSLTDQAHNAIRQHFASTSQPLTLAVDATCGNGNDTLFLSQLGFEQVIAFDIQKQAIEQTRQHCQASAHQATLIHDGHQNMTTYIEQEINCIMFNLGYLPSPGHTTTRANKSITTDADSTVHAMQAAIGLLARHGMMTIICYPGHTAGKFETEAVKCWLNSITKNWTVTQIDAERPTSNSPILYLVKGH